MNAVILLAGGIGTRMQNITVPKQYVLVKGIPIFGYSLKVFDHNQKTDLVVIVADPSWREFISGWTEKMQIRKKIIYADPGNSRQESILHGMQVLKKNGGADAVMIHDAARPFVTDELINTCWNTLREHEGVMPCLTAKDTFYFSIDGKKPTKLVDRNMLYAGQTPEAFLFAPYLAAIEKLSAEELSQMSGSTQIAFADHMDIGMIPGEDSNLKITTQTDLLFMNLYLENKR